MNSLKTFLFFFSIGCILNAQDITMPIWPNDVPDAIESTVEEHIEMEGDIVRRVSKVSTPTISIYFPEKKNGSAVLICPGGGYSYLSYTHEGIYVAQWLNTFGVTGIVVKSRLPDETLMTNKSQAPLKDTQQALRLVREKAAEWGIDSKRVGIMGFSEGGHLAASASTHFKDSFSRPYFSALIYPVITMDTTSTHMESRRTLLGKLPSTDLVAAFSTEKQVSQDTPPAFISHSFDDRVVPQANSAAYFAALKKNGVKGSELHIFPNGNHGYGLAKGKQGNVAIWPTLLKNWMKHQGFLSIE